MHDKIAPFRHFQTQEDVNLIFEAAIEGLEQRLTAWNAIRTPHSRDLYWKEGLCSGVQPSNVTYGLERRIDPYLPNLSEIIPNSATVTLSLVAYDSPGMTGPVCPNQVLSINASGCASKALSPPSRSTPTPSDM